MSRATVSASRAGFDRLDEIVEHALRERLHGVLIVGGDEHEVRAAADVVRGFDAGNARHVHVEKADVGPARLELLDRLAAVARLRDDLELGPGLRELARERVAQQRLVVGDQRGRARASSVGAPRAGRSSFGADAVRLARAARAAARRRRRSSCRRSRNVESPVPSPPLDAPQADAGID